MSQIGFEGGEHVLNQLQGFRGTQTLDRNLIGEGPVAPDTARIA